MTSPKPSSITSSVRKTLGRALSLDGSIAPIVRTLSPLRRTLSSGRKSTKDKFHRVVASNDAPSEDVMSGLNLLKTNTKIESVEVVDLLVCSNHKQYMPMAQDIAFAGDAQSRKILFADTLDIDQYDSWKGRKDRMMDAYKRSVKNSNCQTAAAWQATVIMPAGTDLVSMEEFLSNLQGDLSCNNVSFEAASLKSADLVSEIPDKLCSLVGGGEVLQLKEDISVIIACGWGETGEWSTLLERCSSKLSSMIVKGRAPRRKARSGSSGAKSTDSDTEPRELNIQQKIHNVKQNVYLKRSKTHDPAATKKDDDSKSLNTSATSFSSADDTSSSSDSKDKNSEKTAERTTISWKEFGDRNKQRLALRRAATMEARIQSQKAPHAA